MFVSFGRLLYQLVQRQYVTEEQFNYLFYYDLMRLSDDGKNKKHLLISQSKILINSQMCPMCANISAFSLN